MARIRTDNVFGTLTDNPLTNAALTMNSAGLANLAAVAAPDEAIIILNPNRVSGAPEIVVVTAHTGSATSATIVRGQFGTAARQHALGTEWVHGPIAGNTAAFTVAADDQGDHVPLAEWETWTPTFANFTLGNGTVTSRFVRIGRTIHYRLQVVLGSTSSMGTNPTFTIPVTSVAYAGSEQRGVAQLVDAGTADFTAIVRANSTTVNGLFSQGTNGQHTVITATAPFTWTTNDRFFAQGTYEAAS